jgi:hypothetical protein
VFRFLSTSYYPSCPLICFSCSCASFFRYFLLLLNTPSLSTTCFSARIELHCLCRLIQQRCNSFPNQLSTQSSLYRYPDMKWRFGPFVIADSREFSFVLSTFSSFLHLPSRIQLVESVHTTQRSDLRSPRMAQDLFHALLSVFLWWSLVLIFLFLPFHHLILFRYRFRAALLASLSSLGVLYDS